MSEIKIQHIEEKISRLGDVFGFDNINELTLLYEGYRSQNWLVRADNASYFLKAYNRLGHVVHQITRAQRFFSENGIPVLLPIQDVHRRFAFPLDRGWFSMFPFVNGIKKSGDQLTDKNFYALGQFLASIHTSGSRANLSGYNQIHFWQHENFFWEYEDLIRIIKSRPSLTDMDRLVFDTLEEKRKIIEKMQMETIQIPQQNHILIHGDLIFQNIFWDQLDNIASVFDFEKTCVAPRGYEVARSLMINCFEDGWGDVQFGRAHIFLDAYRQTSPISFEEFANGIRMYWMNMVHMTWLEIKYLVLHQNTFTSTYESHANRIRHLSLEDPVRFCERVYSFH